jgi:hypothetical protein
MRSTIQNPVPKPRRIRAFTVVELLVAVSIMTLIILALYGMFDQVQKALRGNSSQVDVLEGGRAAMELIKRELEQMTASNVGGCTNFWVEVTSGPVRQNLVTTNSQRINILESFFFLNSFNREWAGIGYKVVPTNGIGALYRFQAAAHAADFAPTNPIVQAPNLPIRNPQLMWLLKSNTNAPDHERYFQRVTDGVIHFRVTAHDSAGQPMLWWRAINLNPNSIVMDNARFNNVPTGETRYVFKSNAVPPYVEIELGILEPHVLEKYRSMGNAQVAGRYLSNNASAVHLFHQRIPIRRAPMIVVP